MLEIPMNKPKSLVYYDFNGDIVPKLCEYMGIEDFHRNEYGDFWDVFLMFEDDPRKIVNGGYFTLRDDDICDSEEEQREDPLCGSYLKRLNESYGEWALHLHYALKRLHREYGEEITIYISW